MTARRALGLTASVAIGGFVAARLQRMARAIEFAGMTVVIVGGSRGLGLAMARQLASEGARLVLVARDEDELERAARDVGERGGPVKIIPCDVRSRVEVEAAIDEIVCEFGTIDVLINDAGIIQVGPLEHMTIDDFEDAMATNFWGPLFTVMAALPHMRRAGARRIVNISSIGGRVAVPHLLPYSASKFALAGFSEGLHAELAGSGFVVTTVSPGLMRTGSTYNAWFKGQQRHEFAWFHLSDSMPGVSIGAARAARRIIDACRHGDPEVTLTPAARLAVVLKAVSPGLVAKAQVFANWLLPSASDDGDGDEARSGWQSVSSIAPSAVTRLADRATVEHNQIPQGE